MRHNLCTCFSFDDHLSTAAACLSACLIQTTGAAPITTESRGISGSSNSINNKHKVIAQRVKSSAGLRWGESRISWAHRIRCWAEKVRQVRHNHRRALEQCCPDILPASVGGKHTQRLIDRCIRDCK